jgi:hypothetical protein
MMLKNKTSARVTTDAEKMRKDENCAQLGPLRRAHKSPHATQLPAAVVVGARFPLNPHAQLKYHDESSLTEPIYSLSFQP